ncbi:sensor histidine kinase [Actinoalloteichus hymeniacidonis]|uniref:histidine kinase n=1 Tax=Actinoalloteichus hymeniacidonis TaxID=340345 RepID=A0AAC9HNC3_9PSEU|nr:histidine kinase [Actinoalloteichus hymeniacidonis]AOS62379.1 signal transduction histidine kinase [Actinoalloteichus hymeniacidonis]MBB5909592.1 signal transduction histidine kinase [Actinoalloteichus hymeniacidonis]
MHTDVAPSLRWWQQTWRLVAAAAVGIPFWLASGVQLPPGCVADTCSRYVTIDPLIALGCLTALLWRRRFPFTVALAVAIASPVSALATGAGLLALSSISTRRRPVEIGVVGLAYVTASQFAGDLYAVQLAAPVWMQLAIPLLSAGIAVAIGMAVGARRVEVRSLRDRAESAEREQSARAAQARALERNRIAREMHDVLAHRISLVAMQAGVLDHRRELTTEENGVLIRGIADGAHQSLEELRDVLGVLRADPDRPEPPQPSLDGIPELVADARASGLDVTLSTTVTENPSDVVGRTCYRIVQEGLTNAAKHAPGARVHIVIEGTAGAGLHVSVRNAPTTMTTTPLPTSGFGLLGLAERVSLAGGELDHHPTLDNGYLLSARLPWPSHHHEKRA